MRSIASQALSGAKVVIDSRDYSVGGHAQHRKAAGRAYNLLDGYEQQGDFDAKRFLYVVHQSKVHTACH